MTRPEFEIVIGADGKVTVTVHGARGRKCLEYADLVRDIVGREEQRRLTAEYYAPDGQVRIDAHVNQHHT